MGNGTAATPTLVYRSPATINPTTSVVACTACAFNTRGFLGVNDLGDVTFAGAVALGTGAPGTVGIYGLSCASSTPCTAWSMTPEAFSTGPSNGMPTATGHAAVWVAGEALDRRPSGC